MDLVATILNADEYSQWNEFVGGNANGSFIYRTEYANLISYTFDRHYHIVVLKQNDSIVAGLIIFHQKRLNYVLATPVALFPYNGPLIKDIPEAKYHKKVAFRMECLAHISAFLSKCFDYWVVHSHPHLQDARPFKWQNCLVEPEYTYQVKLGDWQKCKHNFNQSVRKKIRQAEQAGIEIVTSAEKAPFLELYAYSYLRHGIKPLLSQEKLEKFLSLALKLPEIKMYYAVQGEKKLAGRLIVEDSKIICDLLAGSNDDTGNGSTYLVYKIIETYANRSGVFDFLGADHEQIEHFKRSFGGELLHGFKISRQVRFPLSWLLNIREQLYKHNRNLS